MGGAVIIGPGAAHQVLSSLTSGTDHSRWLPPRRRLRRGR